MNDAVAAVLLAAGGGTRYGRPKAMITFLGSSLVERANATLEAGGCRPVIVVLGAAAAEIRASCDLGAAQVVVNEKWAQGGMASSLLLGLDEAEVSRATAALVMQVDQPVVTPALVERLITAWRNGAVAAVAAYRGEGLTPVVLDHTIWPKVREVAVGDKGARSLLREQPELVTLVDCDDLGDPGDIDSPADLARLERSYQSLVAKGLLDLS